MKISDIADIIVFPMNSNSVRVEWMALGTRYHVNILRDTGVIQTPLFGPKETMKALYKSPPIDVHYGMPGYFRTTTVNAEAASNAVFVQHVLKQVRDFDMVELTYNAEAAKKSAEAEQRRSEILHAIRIILCDNGMPGQDIDYEQAADIMRKIKNL